MSAAVAPTAPGSSYGFRRCCEAVRGAVPVEEVARRHTELRPYGGAKAWFTGRCPLPDHEDRTPSFFVYPGEVGGRWWCYGCNRGGDVVDLEFACGDHRELWTAMIELSERYGVELPRRPKGWHRRQDEKARTWQALRDVLAASYRRRLFRVFRPILADIGEGEGREREAKEVWDALWPLAHDLAERRLFERQRSA